jgi:hypothetical protein
MAREVKGFFLFELGRVVLLQVLPPDIDLRSSLGVIATIEQMVREFAETKENREDLPDAVSDADDLVKMLKALIEKNPFPLLSTEERDRLNYRVQTFRDRLCANLGRVYSFVLEDKGGRSVKTLYTKAVSLIDPKATSHLSTFVIENIEEAGKCWLADRPTATGFHMVRSIECVLRIYAELVTGRKPEVHNKRGNTFPEGFGTIVNNLATELNSLKAAKTSFGQLEFVIGMLRPLGKLYRDPLSHPDLNKLDEEDAKMAFNQGVDVISRMIGDATIGGPHFKLPWTTGVLF